MSTGRDVGGLSSRSRSGTSARPESSRPQGSGVSGLRDAEILGRAPTGERCRTACYILHAEDYLKYFGKGWRGGLPTSARLYAGELEELYRRSLKVAVFEGRKAQRLYRGGLVGGQGGGDRPARPRRGRRGASAGCPATRVYWPAPVLGEGLLGQWQKRRRPSGWGGGLAGGPTAAVRGSVGRLSAASADVADRRLGGAAG